MLGIFISRALQFATVALAFRVMLDILPAVEVGKFNIFVTICSGTILLTISPFGHYLLRHCAEWKSDGTLATNITAFTLTILFMSLISTITIGVVAAFAGFTIENLAVIYAYVFGVSLVQSLIAVLGVVQSVTKSIWLQIANTCLATIIAILACHLFGASAGMWAAGLAVINIGISFLLKKHIQAGVASTQTLSHVKEMFAAARKFVMSMGVVAGLFWVVFQAPRLYISELLAGHVFGMFAASVMLATLAVGAVESIIGSFTGVAVYRSFSGTLSDQMVALERHLDLSLLSALAILSVGLLAGHTGLVLLAPEMYREATEFWMAALWWETLRLIASTSVLAAIAAKSPRLCAGPLVGVVLLMVGVALTFQGNPRLIINFGVPFCFLVYIATFCRVNKSYRAGMVKAFHRRRWEVLLASGCVATGLIIIGSPITEADPVALVISSLLMCFIWLVSVLRALRTDYGLQMRDAETTVA